MQTVDILSGGRFEFGLGAPWLHQEWMPPASTATRGRASTKRSKSAGHWEREGNRHVWREGECFTFDEVAFEPKPQQRPWPPILVGGESRAALRRAARLGDGWLGMGHTFETAAPQIDTLRALLAEHGRDPNRFQIVFGGPVGSRADVQRWEDLGVTRLLVSPWRRSKEALDGLADFAARIF